jgi:hypothetical protein
MARSVINLLPPELLNTQKSQRTLSIFIWSAGAILIVVIILTATVLLYKLLQIQQLNANRQLIGELTTEVNSLQIQESLLYNVRTRLSQIKQIDTQNSIPLTQYSLTLGLVPSGFKVISYGNDTTNRVRLSVESTGSARLKNLFDSLTNPANAEGSVAKIELDSLSRSALDRYKIDLTINYK